MEPDGGRRGDTQNLLDRFLSESGWRRLAGSCALAPGCATPPEPARSLVFDIDGVLIDTRRSFDEVIPRSVSFYMEGVLGLQDPAPETEAADSEAWRRAGGFNNDWDTAEAGLLCALWRTVAETPVPATSDLAAATAEAGGGLEALRAVIEREAVTLAADLFARVDRTRLERIFKELYVGAPLFERVFGEPTRYWHGPGAVENERPLLSTATRERALQLPLGILTGRIPEEAELALELTGLSGLEPELIVTDDGRFPPKPDPAGLLHLVTRLSGRPLYYFGDNRDDLTAFERCREAAADDRLHFVCCLSGGADLELVRWFAAAGATLIAVGAEEALKEVLP